MDAPTGDLYGGRRMVPVSSIEQDAREGRESVSVLTYNVMRQMHATPDYKPYCDPAVLTATKRKDQIFQELLSYNADILCLQEVDDFTLWWVPRLNAAGYDSVYHQRTGDFDDGLVIAFRRMYFQIFRTLRINLNDLCNDPSIAPNFASKLQQDNVALIVALQPWEQCHFPSAVCVANLQLASHPNLEPVRQHQLAFVLPQVEAFNADFHLPIVIAGSFNATPVSHVYHTMRTGRPRPEPEPPARMNRPLARDPTTSTITLSWVPPVSAHGPILGYRLVRRVNCSTTIGFSHEVMLDNPSQVDYIATMLSAGNTYEFCISAKNAAGWSEYSIPSEPIQTLKARAIVDPSKPPVVLPVPGMPYMATSPYKTSYNSGKTPRFTDGGICTDLCPRPSHVPTAPYESVHVRGDREDKLVHFEVFDSAYGRYQLDGEPDYTFADHTFTGTVDYIFYSKKELAAVEVLSLPPLVSLVGDDARELETVPDVDYVRHAPDGWDTCAMPEPLSPRRIGATITPYMGEWSTEVLRVPNPRRQHRWLPNHKYSSDHVALMAKITFQAEELAVRWN
ncbi:hypothetical protein, variant [Aphanomyces invadans]|uniref:Fibronectin type-III domain-containing protein n=1 Tax=Aphanomyces invadans TaxID=157072 RepID=A0A024TYV2_9STRA|nr:hypothetical protein, variant [Aphanomyces invadans]ETV98801.1 hypothetical protein, variant [Aphanomyces invadans]|eukprot:XP_008872228.1 hypothetical protein, variant [Aphanomyces invadans]